LTSDPEIWPVPLIRGLFERICHSRPDLFGVRDHTAVADRTPLAQATRILTAFRCFAGEYQFTRLPFDPRRASSYFQGQMATAVLFGLSYIICEMYLDDCIVYADGNAQFLEILEILFRVI
jgi:hypothetical protein